MRQLGHNPALDGIRAIGMFVIMVSHLGFLPGAYVFIDAFFLMSGFLITMLLLIEQEKAGRVDVRQFYTRRALRLFPAYFVYLAVGAALMLVLDKGGEARTRFIENTLTSLFYVNNYYRIWHLDGGTWFEQVWSLSVEEQFYLLWPLAFGWLVSAPARRARLLPILLGAVFAFASLRVVLVLLDVSQYYIYASLETRADELLAGCAMAVWRFDGFRAPWRRAPSSAELASEAGRPNRVANALVALGPLALGVLLVLTFTLPKLGEIERWYGICGYSFTTFLAFVMILSLDQQQGLFTRLVGSAPLAALGRISYGFYIWHFPVCAVLGQKLLGRIGALPTIVVVFAVSLLLSIASWKLVEQPMQRWWKKRSAAKKARLAASANVSLPAGEGRPAALH